MIAVAASLVAAVGIGAFAIGRSRGDENSISRNSVAASDRTVPQQAVTTVPTVPVTTAAPVDTEPVPVTTVAVPVTTVAVPPITVDPPSPTVPVIPQGLTYDEALQTFSTYLDLCTARNYEPAWAMLTPRYQDKYLGHANFVRFWETVNGAGIDNSESLGAISFGQSIGLHLWFGRRVDGTVSHEIVEVDLIRDPSSGSVLIDDYRFLGKA